MNTVISFSCPAHLALRLNEENIPPREKSAWISDAIKGKLDRNQGSTLANASASVLMIYLKNHPDCDAHLKEEIMRRLNQPKK